MPKITAGNAKGLLIKYAIKIVVSTILSILLLNMACSLIILKLDLNLNILQYVGAGICIISAIIISFVCTSGFKNNYLILSMISVLPLLIFTVINFCFNGSGAAVIIIKISGILISAFIVSLIRSGKKSR